MTGVGLLLVGVAVGIAGYLVWQLWGTNQISRARHADLVEALGRRWHLPAGVDTMPSPHGEVLGVVRIPRFGDDYAVPLLEGLSPETVSSGFGRYEGSARPGARGNLVIAAHRVTHGEPLRDMPDLRPGDEVVVETARRRDTYVLQTPGDFLRVDHSAGWVVGQPPVDPAGEAVVPVADRMITIVTCAEIFHTDERLVAYGHLERSEAKGSRP